MKEIILTQGKVALVDDEDYDFLMQWKWQAQKGGYTFYAKRTMKCILMHRNILKAKNGEMIDHIDGNGLNNQRANLRFCTNSENQKNKRAWGKSKYKGVGWDKRYNNWTAVIRHNKKLIYIKSFKNEIDAAKAYNDAAIKYHGEFARLNNI